MKLLYQELTSVLRRCIYDVHNALGPGYDEETYHQGLIWRLNKEKVPFRSKEKRILIHRGLAIKGFEIDLIAYDKIILELLKAELDYQKIKYETETPINVEFEGNFIRTYQMKFPVVADRFVCGITAIKGKVDFYDIARIQTYLKALGLHFGVLINFGKKQLEIRGVCA